MATLTQYKGLDVVENATGAGGAAITDDFKTLADRATFPSIASPSSTDDSDDGFDEGAFWFNSTADTMWVCVDSTVNNAVWKSLFKRESAKLTLNPEGDGSVNIDNLSFDGNTISATDTNGPVIVDPGGLGGEVIFQTFRQVTVRASGGLQIKASTGGNEFYYGATGSSDTWWGGLGMGGADDTLEKYWIGTSSAVAKLTIIASSGNVGIAETNPQSKLHVAGDVTIEEGGLILDEPTTVPGTPTAGTAVLYLQSQALKIKFANGTVKTIADNT